MSKERADEIKSLKDLEKEFHNITKLFNGKESENNWNERDASLRRLHAAIKSENLFTWRSSILQGLHDVMPGIIKSIHSLRTSVAMEGLSMIEDTSIAVGEQLDIYTLEIILMNLLKSSSITKKFIAARACEVTNQFLAHISFHSKLLITLCKTKNEKNIQLRQYAAEYVCTVLSTHASKESVRSNIDKSTELISWINQFLKKGLTDASPLVRDGCRKVFGVYHQYFPGHADKLFQTLEKSIQLQLHKAPSQKPKAPRLLLSRSNSSLSQSSRSSSSSPTLPSTPHKPSTTTKSTTASPTLTKKPVAPSTTNEPPTKSLKRPTFTRTLSSSTTTTMKPPLKRRAIIPTTSSEVKKSMSRLSHISTVSAPPTHLNHQLQLKSIVPATTRRTQSEFNQQTKQSAAALMHMLQSNDVAMRRKGIHALAERLKRQVYQPQPNSTPLPPDVPPKMDLLPVLMANLSQVADAEMYEVMESWESIAGIFVHVLGLNYYGPVLILKGGKGFTRLKMFLKRNDPDLAYRLLDMANQLMHTDVIEEVDLLDASVKQAIRLDPYKKIRLQVGLLAWMDELICDYLGMPEEEDGEMVLEGAAWLHTQHHVQASQWFSEMEHIRSYVQFVLQHLVDQENRRNDMFPILCHIAGHLKVANERIFETETNELDKDKIDYIQAKVLGLDNGVTQQQQQQVFDIQHETFSFDFESEEEEDSGMTQDISNMLLKIN